MATKMEKNYTANYKDIEMALNIFRRTDNMQGLIEHLAALLTPDQFRMLYILELNKVPMEIVFVDKDGNKTKESQNA